MNGYAGYDRLTRPGRVDGPLTLAYCFARARRKLEDIASSGTSPIAEEGLRQIAALYLIGSRIRGRSADWHRQYRQQIYALLIEASENWLDVQRARVSARSRLGDALHYIAKHMADLKRLLNNGRIEIDSNVVEWQIRPIALSRKNKLFAEHDEGGRD